MRRAVGLALIVAAAACVAPSGENPAPSSMERAQPAEMAPRASVSSAVPSRPSVFAGPTTFTYNGELTQGGWIRGQAPTGAVSARFGEQALTLDAEGRFFAAFDRDAGSEAILAATLADGRVIQSPLAVAPRAWQIENVNADFRAGVPDAEFTARRQPELARIAEARAMDTGSEGWRQDFVWPATGRISGRFGAQRVYRGRPGSYHTGIDIAGGTGTPYVAPADGVVVLAAEPPFTLEGHLLIIDHGMGLASAFLHSSALLVREGERVRQGQVVGRIGATGRASGPHLHWGLTWRGARLDPLLFAGPMR